MVHEVAIVGVGSARSVRRGSVPLGAVAVEMSRAAIADAGLTPADIDGVAGSTSLPAATPRTLRPGFEFVPSDFLVDHLGIEPVWTFDDPSLPALTHAIQAVGAGAATCVLVNRTMHHPVGRYNQVLDPAARGWQQWTAPYGYVAPASGMAMAYTEYQQRYGARREHMATQAVQARANVQRIPHAYWCGTPLTVEDYLAARVVSDPICLYDADIPVDGGGSFVVTTAARARDLPHRPVHVAGWAKNRGTAPLMPGCLGTLDAHHERGADLAARLWRSGGWGPGGCDVVELYDGFGIYVWYWLEALGFCGKGEAWQFVQEGRIAPAGARPLNTSGGNQGWGRLHGVPQIVECYLQLAGRAGERQLPGAVTAIATYGTPGDFTGEAWLFHAS